MKKDSEEQFKVFTSLPQQTEIFRWKLESPESTIELGTMLTKKIPDLKLVKVNQIKFYT